MAPTRHFPHAPALSVLLLVAASAFAAPALYGLDVRAAVHADATVAGATRTSDAVIATLADARGAEEHLRAALGFAGLPTATGPTAKVPLDAAILALYAASGVRVDADLLAEVETQAAAVEAPRAAHLAGIIGAAADANAASARILSADDRALLGADLATTMKRITFQRDEAPLLAALARANVAGAAPSALALAHALAPADGTTTASCEWVLDLPFVQAGGECDDTYTALNLVQVDYGGNDVYLNNAGAGIEGVGAGVGIDYGAGTDTYAKYGRAQGFALGGVGILYDEGGSDHYSLTNFGQGFAAAGIAMLYDAGSGNDIYESPPAPDTIATKAGGLGGVGVLVDEGGSDHYQQDGLDGFVYGAAGVGLLVERGDGDDTYVSRDVYIELLGTPIGEIVGPIQVSAEVNGLAILYEEGGDDSYQCGGHVRQGCQGAGGVGGVALLLDLAGNDRYALGESVSPVQLGLLPVFPSGQGVAYGEGSAPPGPGVGVLRDVAGDDVYIASAYAQGYATGGLGLLLDEAGADLYAALAAPLVGARGDGATWADGAALGVGVDRA